MKVTYIDHMGTDLSVVNAARVSFNKTSTWAKDPSWGDPQLKEGDKRLIQFLARGCTSGDWESLVYSANVGDWGDVEEDFSIIEDVLKHVKNMPTHWTPFGHTSITLHIKAPIFIARQLGKHQVGLVWNEVSRRYVTDEPEFYQPIWRVKADNVKQGSGGLFGSKDQVRLLRAYDAMMDRAADLYEALLEDGVCAEQARMVLPQSQYSEWYWTGNLYSFANIFIQRTDPHAQKEVQEVARQIGSVIEPLFPVSWKALVQ